VIYADTDFFVALVKKSDWLKASAERLLRKHTGQIWTSPPTLIELLLLSAELDLDPETVIADVLKIALARILQLPRCLCAEHFVWSRLLRQRLNRVGDHRGVAGSARLRQQGQD
jgi:predicted nucleic acid-binding protein